MSRPFTVTVVKPPEPATLPVRVRTQVEEMSYPRRILNVTDLGTNIEKKAIMSRLDLNAVRCEALFASELQRSEQPTRAEIQEAIRRAVRTLGSRGCAARVAQEFGDHPDTAVARMCWARGMVEDAYAARARRLAARHARFTAIAHTARAA